MSDFCPYVGLQPYTEADRDYFFGRERDQRIISANLYHSRLTVVYGPSGGGKSSVLLAGVVPRLRSAPRTAVVICREWQDASFLNVLKSACLKAVEFAQQAPLAVDAALPLDDLLHAAAQGFDGSILILLDQFEEYLLYHRESETGETFDTEFARAVNREEVSASFLIALREDCLSKLDRFRTRIPNLLSTTLRLQHMDVAAAEEAIRKPLDVYNTRFPTPMAIEDDLVGALLAQVRTGQVTLGQSAGIGQGQPHDDTAHVEAPFLQLVMTRLWGEEVKEDSRVLRRSTLDRLGGAQEIVRTHLDNVMQKLNAREQEVCARFFDRLVTPSGSKIAHAVDDLTLYAGDLAEWVPAVLKILSDPKTRVLRVVDPPPGRPAVQRYEVFHDVLAAAVLDWRARYVEAQERAEAERRASEQQRLADEHAKVAGRLRRLSAALAAILLLAAGAASVAWVETTRAEKAATAARAASADARAAQDRAQEQTQLATLRYLAMQAREHRDDQLDLALLLSVEATRIAETEESRTSLLDGLQYNPLLAAFLHGDAQEGTSVAVSPDGKTKASGGCAQSEGNRCTQGHIRLSDATTGLQLGPPLLAHSDEVVAVAYSPDGKMLASGSGDETMILWDMTTRQPLGQPIRGDAQSLAFSPDGQTLASGDWEGTTTLWDVTTRQRLGPALRGHPGRVTSVAFSPDGRTLLSGSDDGTLVRWDIAASLRGNTHDVWSVAFSPDGKTLASGGCDNIVNNFCKRGEIRLWDIASRQPLGLPLAGHTDWVTSVAFSPNGKILASGGCGRSEDGRCKQGEIRFWDVVTGQLLGPPLLADTSWEVCFAFSPDGKILAAGTAENSITLWDAATHRALGKPLRGHTSSVSSVAFSPDGRMLASGSWDRTIILWDVSTSEPLGPPLDGHDAVTSVAFTPDGKVLASGIDDNSVILWDVATLKPVGPPLRGHTREVVSVAFSPDGKTLASSSKDYTIILWDVATRQPLGQPLTGHTSWVNSVAFSPDGKTLVSGSSDCSIILRDVSLLADVGVESWQARACRIANRNLTRAEWTQYMGDAPYRPTCPAVPSKTSADAPVSTRR